MKLSEHFDLSEFACKCLKCKNTPHAVVARLRALCVNHLEPLRLALGNKPITITSGYRCPAHNRAVGGALKSQHVYGNAADIVVPGVSPLKVYEIANNLKMPGLGLYKPGKRYGAGWVHIDKRATPWPTRWVEE